MDSIKLVFHYLSMHLKVSLEYKISFILSTISQILILFVELFTVYSLFSKSKTEGSPFYIFLNYLK